MIQSSKNVAGQAFSTFSGYSIMLYRSTPTFLGDWIMAGIRRPQDPHAMPDTVASRAQMGTLSRMRR